MEMGTYVLIDLLWAGGSVAPAQPTSLRWNWGIFAQTCSKCLEGPYRKDSSSTHPCRAIDRAWEPLLYFQKNMSGYSIWVFIPTRLYFVPLFQFGTRELPILDPVTWVMPLNCTGKVFLALRPCLSPYRDELQMNLSYMVLLDMWNMIGQKFLSFIGG